MGKSVNFKVSLLLYFFTNIVCSKTPNIIFLIIDDLGWNDVSLHGSKQIPTPNIDALAYDGVILNNYYVQPICTPSRGSLMTGKYPIRLGLQHNVIYAEEPWGLSPKETILPQHLKELGYVTHGVGKWHLGFFTKDYLPTNRGFDSFFGYWTGKEDFYTHFEEGEQNFGLDFHDDEENSWTYFGQYGTDVFTHKAVDIIRKHNASKPLFLYLAHQAVHAGNSYSPLQAPLSFVNKFTHIKDGDRRTFAGMVSALDFSIGELFSALEEANMLDNTVLVFTTDNGAAVEGIDLSTGSNWPLRGSKYNMWEGGVRGVAFVWSSFLRNTESKVLPHMMHISDWLPTLYKVAGGDIDNLGDIDGVNLWPSICCNVPSPRDEILLNIDPNWKVEAIRQGKYKLLKGSVFNGKFDGWFDKEGKKKDNFPFTEEDLKFQKQVYEELADESQVAEILLRNYGDDPFSEFKGEPRKKLSNEYCTSEAQESSESYEEKEADEKFDDSCFTKGGFHDPSYQRSKLSDLVVNCGPKPENGTGNCKPMEEVCLFDIENDPCEYNNIANFKPSVVQELKELLNKYRAKSVPIRNLPGDPAANPKFHRYAWVPWISCDGR